MPNQAKDGKDVLVSTIANTVLLHDARSLDDLH